MVLAVPCTVILSLIHWLGPPLFLQRCFEPTLEARTERLAKGPYQENIQPAVRLEPAIHRLQIQAFYQSIYPGTVF